MFWIFFLHMVLLLYYYYILHVTYIHMCLFFKYVENIIFFFNIVTYCRSGVRFPNKKQGEDGVWGGKRTTLLPGGEPVPAPEWPLLRDGQYVHTSSAHLRHVARHLGLPFEEFIFVSTKRKDEDQSIQSYFSCTEGRQRDILGVLMRVVQHVSRTERNISYS